MAGIATGQVVTFSVGSEETQDLFTDIEVYRSRDGEAGPFEEVTGPEWAPARLTVVARNRLLSGKVLELQVMESTNLTITFSGSNPLSAATTATQIQAQSMGLLRSFVEGDSLIIETLQAGANVTLRAVESDGAALLGLSVEEPLSVAFGRNARIPIISGLTPYSFSDPHGSRSYFYRVRFRNKLTNSVSDYSDPFSAQDQSTADPSLLVEGVIDLLDLEGRALEDVEVRIRLKGSSSFLGSSLIAQVQIAKRTDDTGHVAFSLPRGAHITVALTGTTIARDVLVPTDASISTFELLSPEHGSDDAFAVQRPELNYAMKRSV